MKIAILGSAPSSMSMAPFGDTTWKIWGCSPGLYPNCPRVDAWFELHRWEPPVIGNPAQQKPWFSPEYVAWMGKQRLVWMFAKVPEIPGSEPFPTEELCRKFGNFFMTSSISWMMAMAIDQILLERETRTAAPGDFDSIALYGVDMAASEEYGYQRAGCQYFIQMCINLGIVVQIPPESDLLRPMPMYGIWESSHFAIKMTKRKAELQSRLAHHQTTAAEHNNQVMFLRGALDDLEYMIQTWHEGESGMATHVDIWARSPYLNQPPQAVDARTGTTLATSQLIDLSAHTPNPNQQAQPAFD